MKQILLTIIFAVFLRSCIAETVRISEDSMEPSLLPGDFVLISKISYGLRSPGSGSYLFSWKKIKPGELVLINKKTKPSLHAIRRVIATPGESIRIQEGVLHKKNNTGEWKHIPCKASSKKGLCWESLEKKKFLQKQKESHSKHAIAYEPVGENRVFVLSDKRKTGLDSRSFGPITLQEVVGKATHILWPAKNKTIQEQNKVIVEGLGRRKFLSPIP